MDQDSTWYGDRPWSRPHRVDVLRRTQLPPPKKIIKGTQTAPRLFGPCLLWPNGWMDQDAMEVGLGPGHIVLDGDPAPPKRGTASLPLFCTCLSHCVRWGPSSPSHRKGHSSPLYFSPHVSCGQTVAHLSYWWALVKLNNASKNLEAGFCPDLVVCFPPILLRCWHYWLTPLKQHCVYYLRLPNKGLWKWNNKNTSLQYNLLSVCKQA